VTREAVLEFKKQINFFSKDPALTLQERITKIIGEFPTINDRVDFTEEEKIKVSRFTLRKGISLLNKI